LSIPNHTDVHDITGTSTPVDDQVYMSRQGRTTTIRVSQATRDRLARLAATTGRPMTELVDQAADALERRLFSERLTARYDELRDDPEAWAEIEAERDSEPPSLADRSR
jgi:predicted transcriptional regulator